MKKEIKDLIKVLLDKLHKRMAELEPQYGEAVWLQRELEIVEFAIKQRDELMTELNLHKKPPSKDRIERWANALDYDQIVKPRDLADEFRKSYSWADSHLRRLVKEDIMEKWGKGQYRRKPERTGEARLKVVTR